MGIADRVKRWWRRVQGLGVSSPSVSDRDEDNFICAVCQTTFQREHVECPECGGRVVLPIEDVEEAEKDRLGG